MASPSDLTIAGARQGYNARLTVSRYGSTVCRVIAVATSVRVIASDESAGRRRAFYPFVTTGSSFEMAVVHTSWEDREAFNKWLRTYMERVVNNDAIGGTILVEVPVRRFARVCVPRAVLNYGEQFGAITYTTSLSFAGATDPMSAIGTNNISGDSYVKQARVEQATSKHFLPSGSQVAGAESLAGTIFDETATTMPTLGPVGVGVLLPGQSMAQPEDPYLLGGIG